MIPTPNLDDRKFDDIVQEAIRLIPQYCPEWTNHNSTDPGITLIELFAWMTEMTLYRLNRVPDKNFIAFLELMGIELTPPHPARTVMQFEINPKADRVDIPVSTRVGTKPGPDGQYQTFETVGQTCVTTNSLVKCMSQHHESFADNTALLGIGSPGVPVWAGARNVERYLYLSDPRLEAFDETTLLTIRSTSTADVSKALVEILEWEYWDGERWRQMKQFSIESKAGEIVLMGQTGMEEVTVNDEAGFFVRGRLSEVPQDPADTMCDTLAMRLELVGEGEFPDLAMAMISDNLHARLDVDRNFQPFGREPHHDSCFYIFSERVLGHPEADIRIDFELADSSTVPKSKPSEDLVLCWEYYNGKRWKLLGRNGFGEFDEEDPGHRFRDDTRCFSVNGTVSFRRPKDLREQEVSGEKGFVIRARIERGDYGVPGSYELEDDRWVWKDAKPLRPPTMKEMSLRFAEKHKPFAKAMAYNDFVYTDYTTLAKTEVKPFQPFTPVADESPTIYLGFREPFPNQNNQIYFDLVEGEGSGRRLQARGGDTAVTMAQRQAEQLIAWEYWGGKEWKPLVVRDHTQGFTQSDFIDFIGPRDHHPTKRYGENLYWLRARLEFGGYDVPPELRHVLLNCAYAKNLLTYGETILGSSTGLPNQSFKFPRGPVLPGQEIWVLEREAPPSDLAEAHAAEAGEGCFKDDPDGKGMWVKWIPVEGFYESVATSRHYMMDTMTHTISFGEGIHGMVPPKANRNIRCDFYQVGGGDAGNVPPGSLTVLLQSVSYVTGVTNLYAATGGSDLETIEEAKQRGPHSLKAKNRAVTADDFEWLAKESSNSVARVCALPTQDKEGQVSILVVPKVAENHADFMEKPLASTELLRTVRNYLSDRKLLTTVLNVQRPVFRELSVVVEIILLQAIHADRVKREIEEKVRLFVHPLKGGKRGLGWPFGRAVYRVDLYHVVEAVSGVDFVDRVRIISEETKQEVDQFKLLEGELVHCVNVEIIEKAHDRIM
jgi:hypothetical protein